MLALPPNQHLVRMYTRFDGKYGDWRHFEVAVERSPDGRLHLRHLFATPMRIDLAPPVVVDTRPR